MSAHASISNSTSLAPVALRGLAVVASAAAYAASFPPWNLPWLAYIGIVPFLWALRRSTPRGAALAGFVWGTLCISFFGYWVPIGLAVYYKQPGWFGFLFALGVAIVFKGSYFAFFGWIYRRVYYDLSTLGCIAFTAALYVVFEFARASLLTGHPWLLLGYAAVAFTTWSQMADIGGVYLLSFGIVAINAAILELLQRSPGVRRGLAVSAVAALLAAPLGYGAWRDTGAGPNVTKSRIGIVQADVDLGIMWKEEFYGAGLQKYGEVTASMESDSPDLVVWPENALMFFLADEPLYLAAVTHMLAGIDTELVTGGPYYEPGQARGPIYNSAFHVTPDGIAGRYDKVHLLPFAEYFPLSTIRFLRRKFERVSSFAAADEPRLLDTRIGRVGTLICFEAIFPALVRRQVQMGAEILFNLSNDAWLLSEAGGEQHLQMVRLRAIETRRWVVRSTTTGISAFIDPSGRVHGRLEANTAGTLLADVELSRASTIYVRFGDWFAWLCTAAVVLAVALRGRKLRNDG